MTRFRALATAAVFAPLIAAGSPAVAAQTHTIAIEGMQFAPAAVTVKRGDTIVWVNRDLVPHTVTARGAFDSGPIAAGKAWKMTAKAEGRYEYVCTLHPTMKATLAIE